MVVVYIKDFSSQGRPLSLSTCKFKIKITKINTYLGYEIVKVFNNVMQNSALNGEIYEQIDDILMI
ncbi:hypothetical protein JCM19376_13210 [Fusibacter bizertensis]